MRHPIHLAAFRDEAREKILPALEHVRLESDPFRLMLAYFSLGPFELEPFLRNDRELALIPCLDKPEKHRRFCERVVWAVTDPWAPMWIAPRFYLPWMADERSD